MRRADRNEELEHRRQTLEDKERRRKDNKRKRDEQATKQREVQRKLLSDGKIALEDTWAKVTASQPRLNTFFTKKAAKSPKPPYQAQQRSPLREMSNAGNKANGLKPKDDQCQADQCAEDAVFDSEEDTLVDRTNVPNSAAEPIVQEYTDADLLQLFSSQPRQLTPSHQPLAPRSEHDKSLSRPTKSPCHKLQHELPSKMAQRTPSKPAAMANATTTKSATKTANQEPNNPITPQAANERNDNSNDNSSPVLPSTEPADSPTNNPNARPPTTPITPTTAANLAAASSPDTQARRARSATPSPEISPVRRIQQASQLSFATDDGLDDAALVAFALGAERRGAVRGPADEEEAEDDEDKDEKGGRKGAVQLFSSSLPDEEMLEAVKKVEGEEGEK